MQRTIGNKQHGSEVRIQAKHKDPSRPGRPPAKSTIPVEDVGPRLVIKDQAIALLSVKEVARRTTLSRGQIYRLLACGGFPPAVSLSVGRRAWVDSEINDWIKTRMAERDTALFPSATKFS